MAARFWKNEPFIFSNGFARSLALTKRLMLQPSNELWTA
jgi:hypothetical protein